MANFVVPNKNSKPRATAVLCCFALLVSCWIVGTAARASAQIVLPSSGDINTVAGDGTQGFSGDGAAATSAEILFPYGVAVDSSGNIYIADYGNARVRKVTASTGYISTVAGGGSGCVGQTDSIGDGCPATSAQLDSPVDVAVDGSGNIFIADSLNGVIREVSGSTGYISTFAGAGSGCVAEVDSEGDGCAATDAVIRLPEGVAVDSSGDVFIADYNDSLVREVVPTGTITAVVSTGLNNPFRVAVDGSGNLYVSDNGNDRICNGAASTVAGTGTVGYSGDGGAATSAEVHYVVGVAVDASGNIYFADSDNSRIRAVGH